MIPHILLIVLLVFSWVFIIFGMIAIFELKNLYTRLLSASTIDTVACLTILFALFFAMPSREYIIRLVILIGFLILTSPISSHVIIRSAYLTGYPLLGGDNDE